MPLPPPSDTFNDPHLFFINLEKRTSSMQLGKLCKRCGKIRGINFFFVDEKGNWSEKCKYCTEDVDFTFKHLKYFE